MSERTIRSYIDATASASPAPGAGSVAAISGAMGAALGEMVCNITVKSSSFGEHDALSQAEASIRACRERLIDLSPLDETAYLAFRDAQALPKNTDTEKAERRGAMQSALIVAADVPLEIAQQGTEALRHLENVARFGSKYTLADIATAAHVLNAAVLGAIENVNVNITLIKEPVQAERLTASVAAVESMRDGALQAVLKELARRQTG